MATARGGATATMLGNGEVLVAGGGGLSGDIGVSLASAELLQSGEQLLVVRRQHDYRAGEDDTATLLGNGKVLVAGGGNDSGLLTGAELYNPISNSWSSTGTMDAGAGLWHSDAAGQRRCACHGRRDRQRYRCGDRRPLQSYDEKMVLGRALRPRGGRDISHSDAAGQRRRTRRRGRKPRHSGEGGTVQSSQQLLGHCRKHGHGAERCHGDAACQRTCACRGWIRHVPQHPGVQSCHQLLVLRWQHEYGAGL